MPAIRRPLRLQRTALDILINEDQALMPLYNYVTINMIDTNKVVGAVSRQHHGQPSVKDIYLK
jgi:oligopeptide transport system substrate-binding protein